MTEQTLDPSTSNGRLHKFFDAAIRMNATDLIIKPDVPAKLRIRNELRSANADPFTAEELQSEIRALISDGRWKTFESLGAVDFAYEFDADNRFRVNAFQGRSQPALAARRISSDILSFEELNLPSLLNDIAKSKSGLVLLCGDSGCGKSTTLASMIQVINESRPCHILTIEDPIEFIFRDNKAIVNQREIGTDVPDFPEAMRAMVRENPDVILVGEMRDTTTLRAALSAAETGHLVFGTIHASSAAQVFGRIYNMFPQDERELVREMLAFNLRAVVYQKLLPALQDGLDRIPACEVLTVNTIIRKYILDHRETEISDMIKNSKDEDILDLAECLVKLVRNKDIHLNTALDASRNAEELRMRLKGIVAN